jgi:hypothetical protein
MYTWTARGCRDSLFFVLRKNVDVSEHKPFCVSLSAYERVYPACICSRFEVAEIQIRSLGASVTFDPSSFKAPKASFAWIIRDLPLLRSNGIFHRIWAHEHIDGQGTSSQQKSAICMNKSAHLIFKVTFFVALRREVLDILVSQMALILVEIHEKRNYFVVHVFGHPV